jgi:hypothetical protein
MSDKKEPTSDRQLFPVGIQRSEWWFVFIVAMIILVFTSLPYVYGYLSTPSDQKFMGMMLDVPDHLQYFSWMRELSTANLAANKLTPEPNKPVFFNLLWWGLGRLGNVLGWGYPALYQLLRVLAVGSFLPLAYLFCARFFEDLWQRKVAFLTICLTSGLGWILVLLKYTVTKGELLFPLDVFVAEGNTFLGILGYPHFIAALLYIFVFYLVLRGEGAKKYSFAVLAGLFAQFLGWQHAYDLIIVYGVLGAYGVLKMIRDRKVPVFLLVSGVIIVGISCWPAVYSVMLTSLDPLWEEVLAQFANAGVYTPNLLHLPILLGIAFVLALITAIRDHPFRSGGLPDYPLFITSWFWVSFILVYLPVDYQIHMLNGWQIPIALLAVKGLFDWIIPFFEKKLKSSVRLRGPNARIIIPVIFLISISMTNIYLWAWRFLDLSRHNYPFYLNRDEVNGLDWLERNGSGNDVVISSLDIGQYVPALTGKTAFLAHWAQTINYHEKVGFVEQFFSDQTDDELRKELIRDYGIRFVFYGPAENSMGDFDPSEAVYLEKVYSSPAVEIFQVR